MLWRLNPRIDRTDFSLIGRKRFKSSLGHLNCYVNVQILELVKSLQFDTMCHSFGVSEIVITALEVLMKIQDGNLRCGKNYVAKPK
jgi:hypothetical protein